MISNYFKSFIRFLGKHKAYSIINISGLAIGMAAAILIYLWILDELRFDAYHENYDNIYRIVSTWDNADGEFTISATAAPLAPEFEESFPEILESARFRPALSEMLVSYGDRKYYEDDIAFVDKEFFRIFTYQFLSGSSADPFPALYSAVITRQIADKYFGDEDPVGKTISLDDETPITVTGVIEKVPVNSHLHFDILLNFELISPLYDWDLHWEANSFYAYVLLQDDVDYPALKTKIDTLTKQLYSHGAYEFHLQPLSEVHLRSSFDADVYGHTEPKYQYIRIFILIGVLIVLISVINYVNLSTARSATRAREIGLRKVNGAGKIQLIRQFMGESFLICLLSYLIAMLLVEIVLPYFNQFTGKEVSVNYADPIFTLGVVALLIFTAILSGAYPSMYMASFFPVKILYGDVKSGPSAFRKVLVFVQFSITTLMIICSLIAFRQLSYLQNHNLGINTDQVVYFSVKGNIGEKYDSFREKLLQNPDIKGVGNSQQLPTNYSSGTYGISWEGRMFVEGRPENPLYVEINKVDYGFIPTFGIEMAEGRNFSRDRPDDLNNYILNETAVRQMQLEDPVGKKFNMWGSEGQIIGVMKDFNFQSLHKEIEPLCLFMRSRYHTELSGYIFVKLDGRNVRATMKKIESEWTEINPAFPLDYHFLDDAYDHLYISESRLQTLFTIFALLSVFLSCMGLYGLTSFHAEKRTREIGIRKALGAGYLQIMTLFSWDALKWILVSNLVAWPIAWLYMKGWLNDFAYKTNLTPWIFLLSGLIVLLISLFTISFQSQKAARVNPAESVKYE